MKEKILKNHYEKILPLNEVKNFLRIVGNEEDELVSSLCKTVIKNAEGIVGFEISHKEILLYGEFRGEVRLKAPLIEVLCVKSEGKVVGYKVERQILKPSIRLSENLEIEYCSGLIEGETPDDLKSALIQHLISLYDLRLSGGRLPQFSIEVYNRYRMVNL
jgi:hypothetical protein